MQYMIPGMMMGSALAHRLAEDDRYEQKRRTLGDYANGRGVILNLKHICVYARDSEASVVYSIYRKVAGKYWFKDHTVDCLFRAYIDRDWKWFMIICRYWNISVDALETLRIIIGKDVDKNPPTLRKLDEKRFKKLMEKDNWGLRGYHNALEKKIFLGGAAIGCN